MRVLRGITLIVLCFSVFLLAGDGKLTSVSFGILNEQDEKTVEIVRFDLTSQDFNFQIDNSDPATVKMKIALLGSGVRLSNASGKTVYSPPSGKISTVFIEQNTSNGLSIRINLKSNYVIDAEKTGNSIYLKVFPDAKPSTSIDESKNQPSLSKNEIETIQWTPGGTETQDFFYRGFALITLNYASIDGNAFSYSNGIFEFDRGFSSRQKLSFLGDGRVFGDWNLSVQAYYDPLDDSGFDYKPISNLYLFAKLENGLNYISAGDHDKESFTNLYLNRITQAFFGAEVHLENEIGSATALAAVSKGGSQVQEFQADNSTGPLQLSRTPVVINSEFVTIEERDRNSTTRVINSAVQTRGVDYFIDYEEGEITFVTPIAKETFDRNPNYIVVRFQYEQLGSDNEYLAAAQLQAKPFSNMNVGATYIGKFTDGNFDNREEALGLNANYNNGDLINASAEVSLSNQAGSSDDNGTAYYFQMQGKVGSKLQYRGSYQRIDADYINLANTRLGLYTNQSRVDSEAVYALNEYINLSAGYRSEESNIDHSDDDPSVTNSSLYGQCLIKLPYAPSLTVRYDKLRRYDDLAESESTIDYDSDELTINAEKRLDILGETGIAAIYRHTAIDDKTGDAGDGTIDLYGVKLINRPLNDVMVYGEYKLETGDVTGGSGVPVDYYILGAGGRISPFMNLSIDLLWEERDREIISTGIKESEETVWSVGGAYTISSSFRIMGRYEDRVMSDYITESNNQKQKTANLKFFYNPLKNFRIGLGYEMEDREILSANNNESYEDRLLVEASFKQDKVIDLYARYEVDLNEEEYPPLPVTTAENTINLVGVRFWISDKFDFLGRYKTQKITGADNNTLGTLTFEAGYQIFEEYKFILGFEAAKFEHPTDLSDNYDANNLYLRLVAVF